MSEIMDIVLSFVIVGAIVSAYITYCSLTSKEKIKIKESDSIGFDFCEFFICTKCKRTDIRKVKFCPMCGVELEWKDDE